MRSQDGILDRSATLLDIIAESGSGLSIQEISLSANIPTSTTYRLLTRLVAMDLVDHDVSTNTYRVGVRVLRWGAAARLNLRPREIALPVMRALRDEFGETIQLAVRDGVTGLFVESVESAHAFRQHTQVGQRFPLHAGASMRTILAFSSEETIATALHPENLVGFDSGTMTDPDVVRESLARIREIGYAVSSEEIYSGSIAIAAPVFDATGEVLCSLTISAPLSRMSIEAAHSLVAHTLVTHASAISSRFGHVPTVQPEATS